MLIAEHISTPRKNRDTQHLMQVSKELEAAFIAEMLKSIEPDNADSSFSGGVGEGQFQSFLLEQRAHEIVEKGGFGLASSFVSSMEKGE